MIPTDKEERAKMIRYMLDGVGNDPEKFSDWELNFILSVTEQFDNKGTLSDKQCEILERIYDK